jgi:Fe-S-cluster-containing dehydrogenase component
MSEDQKNGANKKNMTRRNFLVAGGTVVAAETMIVASIPAPLAAQTPSVASYPESRGYLVYDSKKCIGCTTCMLSCSLTHHGHQSLSLARIQIIQYSFGKFPKDLTVAPCRHCKYPVCVASCPVGAAYIDAANGNLRRIDSPKCIGCKICIQMCPQQPHRIIWNHMENKSTKCDLCLDTPYWDETGGPGGKQSCVESCPVKALKFVTETPNQEETNGYDVNLRNHNWLNLGLVDNSTIIPPIRAAQAKPKG